MPICLPLTLAKGERVLCTGNCTLGEEIADTEFHWWIHRWQIPLLFASFTIDFERGVGRPSEIAHDIHKISNPGRQQITQELSDQQGE